jgi:hypothetical protein
MLNALDMTWAGVGGGVVVPGPHAFAKSAPRASVRPPAPALQDLPWHRSPGIAERPGRTTREAAPAAASPAVFAAIAYPTLRGLSLTPAVAFETQRIAQEQEAVPTADGIAAAKAYGAPLERMTGFLGLLDPLDLRV